MKYLNLNTIKAYLLEPFRNIVTKKKKNNDLKKRNLKDVIWFKLKILIFLKKRI